VRPPGPGAPAGNRLRRPHHASLKGLCGPGACVEYDGQDAPLRDALLPCAGDGVYVLWPGWVLTPDARKALEKERSLGESRKTLVDLFDSYAGHARLYEVGSVEETSPGGASLAIRFVSGRMAQVGTSLMVLRDHEYLARLRLVSVEGSLGIARVEHCEPKVAVRRGDPVWDRPREQASDSAAYSSRSTARTSEPSPPVILSGSAISS